MRPRLVVTVALLAACQAPTSPSSSIDVLTGVPKPGNRAPGDTAIKVDSTPAARATLVSTGHLVDGGNWQPGIGDNVPAGTPYHVRQRFVFTLTDTTGAVIGVDSVARVDSVAFYDAWSSGSMQPPPGALGPRAPQYDCTQLALMLECPATNTPATDLGNYVVYVSPDSIAGLRNAGVVGSFQLYVYQAAP